MDCVGSVMELGIHFHYYGAIGPQRPFLRSGETRFHEEGDLRTMERAMLRGFGLALLLTMATTTVYAADLVRKTSPHSVQVTVDRLAAAVEGAGATVFARVDHAAGAQSVGAELRPTELLIFGNPKLGTPAMQAAQSAGLDLPLRVVVFEEADGTVVLAYHPPAQLAADHGLPADAPVLAKMQGALSKLTDKAVSE